MTPPDRHDLGYLVNTVARILRHDMALELSPLELTPQQAAVLIAVSASQKPPTITQVASQLGMDRPTMTGVLDRLVKSEWIETMPNPADGRSRLIRCTGKSLRVLPTVREASARVGENLLQGLSDQEATTLHRLLDQMVSSARCTND